MKDKRLTDCSNYMGNMCILISVLHEPPLIVLNGPVHFSEKEFIAQIFKSKKPYPLNLGQLYKK